MSLELYRIYHNTELLKDYPCPKDGIRKFYNTLDNPWGKYYNEFCVWFDPNIKLEADYIGLEHYRRTLDNITPLTVDLYLNLLELKDPEAFCYFKFLSSHGYTGTYMENIGISQFRPYIKDFLDTNYPEVSKYLDFKLIRYLGSIFVAKREEFEEYRKFIVSCKNHLESVIGIKEPDDILKFLDKENFKLLDVDWLTRHRAFAYLFEFLTSIWILSHYSRVYSMAQAENAVKRNRKKK